MSNYDDMAIVEMVKSGIPLAGEHDQPTFTSYPPDRKPATASIDERLDTSVWRRLALQTPASTDLKEVEQKLYEASLEEVAAGFLKGPYSKEQIDGQFGANNWLFRKRFALMQGIPEHPKVRVIDDCRRSGLNPGSTPLTSSLSC